MPGLTITAISTSTSNGQSRKRTMSFSNPQLPKAARTLSRTASYVSLSDMQGSDTYTLKLAAASSSHRHDSSSAPYPPRSPRQTKEQRERRKNVSRSSSVEQPLTIRLKPRNPPPAAPKPTPVHNISGLRVSSPLAPIRTLLPPRATFPRSKPEPDLYRVAITTRMRMSAEGQKILHMGPRLAFSIHSATQELERIVASQGDTDGDVSMCGGDPVLSTSWVVVPQEDWEMVDNC